MPFVPSFRNNRDRRDGNDETERALQDIREVLHSIRKNQEKMMATLDQVLADVEDEKTVIASLVTFIQGLQTQIANLGLSAADQAKVDAIFADAEANKAALAAAMTANTPAAPSP